MKTEIELDNLTKEEQEIAKKLAEKKVYWVPNVGEHYWYFKAVDDVFFTENNETEIDKFRISIGNCFKTEKEAKEAITRLKMQTKWKRLSLEAGEADNPWDGEHEHHFAYWSYSEEEICYYHHCFGNSGQIYFPFEKSLEAAIAKLGEENVKKYILGVTE